MTLYIFIYIYTGTYKNIDARTRTLIRQNEGEVEKER